MMKNNCLENDSKGAVMTLVIVVIIMLVLLGSFVANLCYNQRKLADAASGQRIKKYYLAQAGVVDAFARLRANNVVPAAGTNYSLDVDGDTTLDVNVTIDPVSNLSTGARRVQSKSL